jgi:hypothetical protein
MVNAKAGGAIQPRRGSQAANLTINFKTAVAPIGLPRSITISRRGALC